jgi:hypothetical protein
MNDKNYISTASHSRKSYRIKGFTAVTNVIAYLGMFYFFSIFVGCVGCPYSFSGASVPPHISTVAIPFTEDKSGAGESGLRDAFSNKLTQKFIDDNNLKITDKNSANALLETAITSVTDAPAVVTSGETVTTRRVTLVVQVSYKDLVKKKTFYDKQFNNYGDYSVADGKTGRDAAISDAIDKITDDILLETVSGW